MAAYLVLQITITDDARWRRYREAVLPLIARFGGRRVAAGRRAELFEGSPNGQSLSMYAFPSMDALSSFWISPEYASMKELRQGAAELRAWAVGDE